MPFLEGSGSWTSTRRRSPIAAARRQPTRRPITTASGPGSAGRPTPAPRGFDIDAFMNAIAGLESGGNPNAQNPTSRAYGLFQIMPNNWSPWAREAGLSGNAPRTPENQRAVARHKMLSYARQFGNDPAAVAIAWFAGPGRARRYRQGDRSILNMSDRKSGGSYTVGKYVNEILGRYRSGKPITTATGPGSADRPIGNIGNIGEAGEDGSGDRELLAALLAGLAESGKDFGEDGDIFAFQQAGLESDDEDDLFEYPQGDETLEPIARDSAAVAAVMGTLGFEGVRRAQELPGDLGLPEIAAAQETLAEGKPPAGAASADSSGFVKELQKYLGVPYVWGGTSPSQGFDCSGLIQYAASRLGVSLPRVSRDQAKAGRAVPSLDAARPGDLVAFARPGRPVHHIGVYVGNGQMLHAPRSGKNVEITTVGSRNIAAIRRVM